MLFLPPEGRNLTVQDLDRPPLGHNRDGRSAPANATPAGPAQAATRRDPSRPPSPNGQPGNVSPKATRKLSTRTHARSIRSNRKTGSARRRVNAYQPVLSRARLLAGSISPLSIMKTSRGSEFRPTVRAWIRRSGTVVPFSWCLPGRPHEWRIRDFLARHYCRIAGRCHSQRQFVSHMPNGIFVGVKPVHPDSGPCQVRAVGEAGRVRGACHGRAVGEQAQRGQVPVPEQVPADRDTNLVAEQVLEPAL
jgi:hypothetical protein